MLKLPKNCSYIFLAPVVQMVDNAIHRINLREEKEKSSTPTGYWLGSPTWPPLHCFAAVRSSCENVLRIFFTSDTKPHNITPDFVIDCRPGLWFLPTLCNNIMAERERRHSLHKANLETKGVVIFALIETNVWSIYDRFAYVSPQRIARHVPYWIVSLTWLLSSHTSFAWPKERVLNKCIAPFRVMTERTR